MESEKRPAVALMSISPFPFLLLSLQKDTYHKLGLGLGELLSVVFSFLKQCAHSSCADIVHTYVAALLSIYA